MFIWIKDKQGVSVIIGYVLLIVIAISLSIIVFTWLRGQVNPAEVAKCPDGVSVIIKNINCDKDNEELVITLQNKGLFSVNGSIIRVNNRSGAKFGIYNIFESERIEPGKEKVVSIAFGDIKDNGDLNKIRLVEVQGFIFDEKDRKAYCEGYVSEVLDCNLRSTNIDE